jgi:Bacterial mobilisation protein (MobC)
MARIGNNLNQLARWANTERRAADVATLHSIGRQLAQLREAVVTAPASDDGQAVVDLTGDEAPVR